MDTTFPSRRWDIFCTVIDNFGDIGICWRLARQLAGEYGQDVTLWVDDLSSFRKICPEVEPTLARQSCRGVTVRLWSQPLPALAVSDIPDIVIEGFACQVPESYIRLMAEKPQAPLWLNMEYLSAEDWVTGCHGLRSPQPHKLQKTFWFPGFVPGTGGLLRESDLAARRDTFLADPQAQQAFWQSLDIPAPQPGELRLSMFGYDNPDAELQALVDLWSRSPEPVSVCAADGKLAQQLQKATGGKTSGSNLALHILPFLEQDRYDQLLWACDMNFVRGEDSFVRAQWAEKPFAWQAYRQEEATHLVKLEAFLALYRNGLSPSDSLALQVFWRAWNTGTGIAAAWPAFAASRQGLRAHSHNWSKNMQNQGDFTGNLMLYCQNAL